MGVSVSAQTRSLVRMLLQSIGHAFDLIEELVTHPFFHSLSNADWKRYQLGPLIICSLLINLFELASPLYINIVYSSILPTRSMESLLVLSVGVVVLMLIGGCLKSLRSSLTGIDGARLEHHNRMVALDHFSRLPLGTYTSSTPAAHIERLTSISLLRDEASIQSLTVAIDLFFSLVFVLVLFIIGGSMGFIALVAVILYFLRSLQFARDYEVIARQRDALDLLRNTSQGQLLDSAALIKANGLVRQYLVRHEKQLEEVAFQRKSNAQFTGQYQAFSAFASQMTLASMVTWGAYLVITEHLLVGALAACLLLTSKVLGPWQQAMDLWNNYRRFGHARDQYYALLAEPLETTGGEQDFQLLAKPGDALTISVADYFQCSISVGSVVWVRDQHCGADGRMLFMALQQLQTINRLHLNNVPIESFPRNQLRQFIAFADPSVDFFDGSLLQNLTSFQASRYQRRAFFWSYLSGLDDKVRQLPQGYSTVMGKGHRSGLSGDAFMLAHLVRALATNPQVLLIDLNRCAYGKEFIAGLEKILQRTRGRITILISGGGRVLNNLCQQKVDLPQLNLDEVLAERKNDNNQQISKNASPQNLSLSLLRDLTLSTDAPMAFCVRLLLQQLKWMGRPEELFELMSGDPCQMDLVDARNLLLSLGFSSRQLVVRQWSQLKTQILPTIYVDPSNIPWVLMSGRQGQVFAANAIGRTSLEKLTPGGQLVLIQERVLINRVGLLQQIFFRFIDRISLLYGISLSLALIALTLPFYIRTVYNIVIPSSNAYSTAWLFAGVLVVFFLDWVLRQWRSFILAQLVGRIDALISKRLLETTFGLDLQQLESLGLQGVNSLQRNLDNLLTFLQGPLAFACLDFPFIFIYLIAIFLIGGALVWVPLLFMALSGMLVWSLSRLYGGAAALNMTSGLGLSQALQELVNRFLEVKLAKMEWIWLQRLRGLSAESTCSGLALNQQVSRLQVITLTATQLAGVLTLAVGTWMASTSDQVTVAMGNLIAAMFFVWRVFSPFQQLMNVLLRFTTMRSQYQQLDQFLRMKPQAFSAASASQSHSPRLQGSVFLDSVACRLAGNNGLILTRISFSVSPGQILAITGNVSCGKSAVLKLIDQLYPLTSGSLLLDGKDYRQFSSEGIQRNIAYLMPNSSYLPGTVWDNLTASNPDIDLGYVYQVCDALRIRSVIEALPSGFHTIIDDRMVHQLPAGSLKLLGLAQVLIKDAPILLLDDLSQGLTPEQFDAVLKLLPTLTRTIRDNKPRSVIVATDNNQLLQSADLLCILEKGVTVFNGTPDQLRNRIQKVSTAD